MDKSPTPSSYEHDPSGQSRGPRSRLSRNWASNSSESTLSSSGKRDSFSRDNLDPASYGALALSICRWNGCACLRPSGADLSPSILGIQAS